MRRAGEISGRRDWGNPMKLQRRDLLTMVAVFLSAFVTMADFIMYPVLYQLYQAFPADEWAINAMVSLPSWFILAACLLSPKLIDAVGSKPVLVGGIAITLVCGALVPVFPTPIVMVVLRLIAGIGMGCVDTAAPVIINESFDDIEQRNWIMGFYSVAMSALGAVLSMVSGLLAGGGWKASFGTYLICVLPLVTCIFLIPNQRKAAAAEEEMDAVQTDDGKLGAPFWTCVLLFIVFVLCAATVQNYVSFYVEENSLGNEAFTGLLTTIFMVVGALAGLVYGYVFTKLRYRTAAAMYAITGIGMLAMRFFPSPAVACITMGVLGASYVIFTSYVYTHFTEIAPPSRMAFAVGIASGGGYVAVGVLSYVVIGLMAVFGTFTNELLLYGCVCIAVAVLELITNSGMPRE